MTSRARPAPAAPAATRRRKLTQKALNDLIDEGIELSLRAALTILQSEEKAYTKAPAINMFAQHLQRRMAATEGGGNVLQDRFMKLMAEIRDVPGVTTLVTEREIKDVPAGELIVDVDDDEEDDFDVEVDASSP